LRADRLTQGGHYGRRATLDRPVPTHGTVDQDRVWWRDAQPHQVLDQLGATDGPHADRSRRHRQLAIVAFISSSNRTPAGVRARVAASLANAWVVQSRYRRKVAAAVSSPLRSARTRQMSAIARWA